MNLLPTNPFDDDHLREECGVFGIFGTSEASINTALGLHALQHRGQEATGIVSFDGKEFHAHRGLDMLAKILEQGQNTLRVLLVMSQLVITAIQQAAERMHFLKFNPFHQN